MRSNKINNLDLFTHSANNSFSKHIKTQSKRDVDANFTIKRNKTYYGYKGHIGMDSDSKMICTTEFTRANIHDSDMFDHVTTGKEESL